MNAQPRRTLSPAPDVPDDVRAAADVVVSGGELLERIERLSAQLAIARTQLSATKRRVSAKSEELSGLRGMAHELERLHAVEQERDELLAANAELTRQLEGMWFQLRSAEGHAAAAEAEASKGLLGRRNKRR